MALSLVSKSGAKALKFIAFICFLALSLTGTARAEYIFVGLDASLSGSAQKSGEAIRRGMDIAIDEINANGGVLGRQLAIFERDNRGIPARGIDNIAEMAEMENLVAVVGGLHTPVALAQLPIIHEKGIPYLGPWAAGTPVVENGFTPNYVFRVSVRDQYAGEFLVGAALERGYKHPGLLLWRNGWGRSNEKAMKAAAEKFGISIAGIQWYNSGDDDLSGQLNALHDAGADVVMLVANPSGGVHAVEAMAARSEEVRLPIVSHWGITGGNFFERTSAILSTVDLSFLQTYSFFQPTFQDRADRLVKAYCQKFGPCGTRAAIFAPVGTAHAYDIVYLLKMAIEKAGSTDRSAVRDAFEQLGRFEGLVRVYDPPFTPQRHDALTADDFRLARYNEKGAILPVEN